MYSQTGESTEADARSATAKFLRQTRHRAAGCEACPAPTKCPRADSCPLKGRRVAVIGGLDRLRPCYTEAIERLGGECCFHTGKIRSGARGLRNLVDKSDLVVCITSINSHGAMHTVKKQCKKCRKPFCPLKGTSVSSLESLLLDAQG